MSKADSVNDILDKVIVIFGTVHILVNNVGQGVRGLFTTLEQINGSPALKTT